MHGLESLRLTDDLPIGAWNEITIKPGRNSFSFGIATDPSRFLVFSIHSPFNKIWASLLEECPIASSQYGYNLGLVNRERITNASQILFVHSFHSQPILAAVRALLYDAESAIPGGCGIDSTDRFAVSTIVTSWEDKTSHLLDTASGNSSERLQWWTSTLRFYAASPPRGSAGACVSEFQANASSIGNLFYHIYHIPLVTSGGSGVTYVNPSTGDVLSALNRLSSYGDAALRGTLVASINARDLKLYSDNSYEIEIARHLGTASVVNVIAEYKTGSLSEIESSTFVAYAPTVLYTCPHAGRQLDYHIHVKSDQLACNLVSGVSVGIQFSIGVIFLAASLFAFSGSYFVWLRIRRSNQYRLWRLARLAPVLSAVLLLTSLFVGSLLSYFDALKNPTGHMCFFSLIYVVLIALMSIYKNMDYIVNVFTHQFTDAIFLVAWLSGSVLAGLITLCTLRLSDSRDHNASRGQAAGGLREPPIVAPTGAVVTTTSRSSRWWPSRQRLFQCWRWDRLRNRGPFTTSDEMEVNARREDEGDAAPLTFACSDVHETSPPTAPVEENQLQTNIAWPPQPLTDRPLAPVLPVEGRIFLDRQRQMLGATVEASLHPPPLIPMSRAQMEAAVAASPAGPANRQTTSPYPCHTTSERNPSDVDVEEDSAPEPQDFSASPTGESVRQ
ncbi:unnamed protein product [Taenia asiatica]|uniref:G_PROTEIN_RECEP_F3_4 domain-containing protein n=1 Tax=Taenia asiatica TaxID=60517 RepID=A0A0R3WB81_TAEAS|nr:unnamed protein product [Taenia asiatica]